MYSLLVNMYKVAASKKPKNTDIIVDNDNRESVLSAWGKNNMRTLLQFGATVVFLLAKSASPATEGNVCTTSPGIVMDRD